MADEFHSCAEKGGRCIWFVSLGLQCATHEVDAWDYDNEWQAEEDAAPLCMTCGACKKCEAEKIGMKAMEGSA